ncbi:MAG: hypothetical protein J1F35_06675 [Erysipelotrichales bacterium]|nr:hypothetical protein [Erysipelotrichales bacterium]
MSKYLIKLGRDNEPKVFDLVPEEVCIFYGIISEYYAGTEDSGYIIKIPDFDIKKIKKFMEFTGIEDIEEGFIKFTLYHVEQLPDEISLGAYDDLVKHFVELIKNS